MYFSIFTEVFHAGLFTKQEHLLLLRMSLCDVPHQGGKCVWGGAWRRWMFRDTQEPLQLRAWSEAVYRLFNFLKHMKNLGFARIAHRKGLSLVTP